MAVMAGIKTEHLGKINAWNHERLLGVQGHNTVAFEAVTTGNYGGFDAWLSEGGDGNL